MRRLAGGQSRWPARATLARLGSKRDGAGTVSGAVRKDRSFGLLGIRERVRQLNGELSIDSAPGRGFRLAIQVPVSAIESADTG